VGTKNAAGVLVSHASPMNTPEMRRSRQRRPVYSHAIKKTSATKIMLATKPSGCSWRESATDQGIQAIISTAKAASGSPSRRRSGRKESASRIETPSTIHQRPATSSSSGVWLVLVLSHASIICSLQVK